MARSSNSRRGGRSNKWARQSTELPIDRLQGRVPRQETNRHGTFNVVPISGTRAVKTYVCPGCGHSVLPGVAHVVTWRADWILGDDAAAADRRHWHERCWRAS